MDNWSSAMRHILQEHRDRPFEWGVSDCSLAFDIARALTGFDAIADIRGYTGEASALRRLAACGFKSTLELVEQSFAEITPSKAQRGDLGYPENIPHRLMSPAVIDGLLAYSKSPGEGWVIVPTSSLVRIFAV